MSVDAKLVALVVFIAAVVAIFCACVAYEYVNDNLAAQLSAANDAATTGPIPLVHPELDEEGADE